MRWELALIPFLLQAIAIGLDEVIFHRKRGLPLWERIGHPFDTLTVLFCMGYVLFVSYSPKALPLYAILAGFSCLIVTKDEFVHKKYCPASENWLHAVLFSLHPITLICAGLIWAPSQGIEAVPWMSSWVEQKEILRFFLSGQFIAMSIFMMYQIIYWNFIWKKT